MQIKLADIFSLNDAYSTTRRVTKIAPEFDGVLLCPENVQQGGLRTNGLFKLSKKEKPLITIVTVVYNGADFLEETIKSVISQSYDNVEYIIVDGGSTDETLDIIRKYNDVIDYWISEKDAGVYYAMNKAERLSSGDFLNFMNAGDLIFSDNVLEEMSEKMLSSSAILYGDSVIINDDKKLWMKAKAFSLLNLLLWSTRVVCHQSMFVRKSIFPEYDTRYALKAELDWYFQLLEEKNVASYTNTPVCIYSLGGISDRLFKLEMTETIAVMFRRFSFLTVVHAPVFLYKIVRRVLK